MSDEPRKLKTVDGILSGYVASGVTRELIEKKLGRDLPDEVFAVHMVGHRMLVAKDSADATYGAIAIPESVRRREQSEKGAGFVLAVGPLVGNGEAPHPNGIICSFPTEVLGKHVYFSMWEGQIFRTDTNRDSEFTSEDDIVIMTDRDILGWDEG